MSLYLFYILLCILPFSIPLQVPLRSNDKSPFDKAFDALASETLERWSMPGLAIAVIDGNKTFSRVCKFLGCSTYIFSFRLIRPLTLINVPAPMHLCAGDTDNCRVMASKDSLTNQSRRPLFSTQAPRPNLSLQPQSLSS